MGAQLTIEFEPEMDGIDTCIDEKALADEYDFLNSIACELKVKPLSEFVSLDAYASFEDEEDIKEAVAEPLKYYDAADGLITINALIEHIESTDAPIDSLAFEELKVMHEFLEEAGKRRIKFCLWFA